MASDSQLRSAGLPSQKQVIELLDGEFARAGYEIEDVVIDTTARPPRITVVADGDERLGSGLRSRHCPGRHQNCWTSLDTAPDSGAPYVLEITSPGVERPLTSEKHYRRARGRKVELTLSDGSVLTGRVGEVDGGAAAAGGSLRAGGPTSRCARLPLDGITKAVVQVEFSPPNQRELELAGQLGKGAGA